MKILKERKNWILCLIKLSCKSERETKFFWQTKNKEFIARGPSERYKKSFRKQEHATGQEIRPI